MREDKLLEEAYAKGDLKLEDPSKELLGLLSSAGENTFKKDKRINIRLSSHDLEGIQRKAAREGLPYQAMISGLIHKYIEGDLVDRNTVETSR